MTYWKMTSGDMWSLYTRPISEWPDGSGCLDYCLANGIARNSMGTVLKSSDPTRTPVLRLVLVGAGSNIGRGSKMIDDITQKLAAPGGDTTGIPITADASTFAAYAASGSPAFQVIYADPNVNITYQGQVWAYRPIGSPSEVTVTDYEYSKNPDDPAPTTEEYQALWANLYGSNVFRMTNTAVPYGGEGVYFPFDNQRAVSFVAASSTSGTALSAMPTHQVGDLLIAYVTSINASAALTPPAGWTSITRQTTTQKAGRLAYKIATSNSEASGTWSDAGSITVLSYRGAGTPGGWAASWGTSAGSVPYPAIAAGNMTRTDGTSWVLRLGYAHNGTASSTMSGYTPRVSAGSTQRVFDSNAGVSTAGSVSASGTGTSASYLTFSLEIPAA